jgi:hypothetical protein
VSKATWCDVDATLTALDDDDDSASGWRRTRRLSGRPELAAVIELVDGAVKAEFDRDALVRWVDEHLVARDVMARPALVTEPGVRPLALRGPSADAEHVRGLLAVVRSRVLATLRGLRGPRRDDRFVAGAIFAGRVRRVSVDGRQRWTTSVSGSESLSEILTALLAVDVLTRRDLYDAPWSMTDEDGWPTGS